MKRAAGCVVLFCVSLATGATVIFSDEATENLNFSGKTVIAPDATSVNIIIYTDPKPKPNTVIVNSPPVYYLPPETTQTRPVIEPRQQRLDDLNKRSSYYRDKQ